MNRRGFLKSILAAGVAPYVVTTAGVLMPVKKIARLEDFKGPYGILYPYTEPVRDGYVISGMDQFGFPLSEFIPIGETIVTKGKFRDIFSVTRA